MESSISDNEAKFDRSSSEASTPSSGGPYEPFRFKYAVKVTEPIKDGESVHYTVKTTRTSDSADFSVRREYEDFEYLHHCLTTQNKIDGIIMPPLPPKPVLEPKETEMKSKQAGSASKVLIGDEFHKDCHALEMYLKLVLSHPTTGESACLEAFLIHKEAPVRAKAKLGFLNKIVSGVWESRKVNHTDIDEFFQKERDAATIYAAAVHDASNSFNKMVYSQQRISNAYAHLSTTLSLFNVHSESQFGSDGNKILVKFAEAVDDAKHGSDVDMSNDENTLGFHLDLYSRYAESVKEMLNRRTCLLVNYEDSNKLLDKAKPAKKAAAEEAKALAEKAFEECSEVARIELAAFKRQRLLAFQEALRQHTEAKIKTARDTYTLLAKSLVCFKQMDKQQQPQFA